MKKVSNMKRGKRVSYKETKIGLHCHCEETQEALLQLFEKAKRENAKYIGITNHKSLGIYTKILPSIPDEILKRYQEIQLIPSIEMSAHFPFKDIEGKEYGIEIHILGYGVDIRKEPMLTEFVQKKYRQIDQPKELERLIQIGHEIGLTFQEEDAYLDVSDGNRRFAGRAFMQAVMKHMEENFNKQEEHNGNKLPYELRTNWGAFQNRCVKDIHSPFYLDLAEGNPSTKEVIQLIHDMGGEAYIAHPSAYFSKNGSEEQIRKAYDNVVKFTEQFMELHSPVHHPECCIDGMEQYHPSYLNDMVLLGKMKSLMEIHQLNGSGGTDIHIGSISKEQDKVSADNRGRALSIKKIKKFGKLKKSSQSLSQLKSKAIHMQRQSMELKQEREREE